MMPNRIAQAMADRRIVRLAAVHRQAADYQHSAALVAEAHRRHTLDGLIGPYLRDREPVEPVKADA